MEPTSTSLCWHSLWLGESQLGPLGAAVVGRFSQMAAVASDGRRPAIRPPATSAARARA